MIERDDVDITEELVSFHGPGPEPRPGHASRRHDAPRRPRRPAVGRRPVDRRLRPAPQPRRPRRRARAAARLDRVPRRVLGDVAGLGRPHRRARRAGRAGVRPRRRQRRAPVAGVPDPADRGRPRPSTATSCWSRTPRRALWALSLADGSAQWVHHFDDVVSATPVATGDLVVVAAEDGSVTALAPGRRRGGVERRPRRPGPHARRPSTATCWSSATVRATLTALDLDDGDELWSAGLSNGLDFGPALGERRGRSPSTATASWSPYDLEDGDLDWQARGRSFPSAPVAVDRRPGRHRHRRRAGRGVRPRRRGPGAGPGSSPTSTSPRRSSATRCWWSAEQGRVTVLDLDDGSVRDTWDLPPPTPEADLIVDTPDRPGGR